MKRSSLILIAFTAFSSLYGQLISLPHPIVRLSSNDLSCPSNSWKLVFNDEFNGNTIDASKWYTYYPYGGDSDRTHGENEGQIYLDDNVVVNGGKLQLIAKRQQYTWNGHSRDYTSGMIHSKAPFSFYYGKMEIKGKIPSGMGFWPAFWLYGSNANEIDVFEFEGENPTRLKTNVHSKYEGNDHDWDEAYNGVDFSLSSHIYTVEWEPNQIIFKVDNTEIRRMPRYWKVFWGSPLYCNDAINDGFYFRNILMPQNPLTIIIDLAIGVTGVSAFSGTPNSSTILPNQFEIDYVRVYQRNPQTGLSDLCGPAQISGSDQICNSNEYSYIYSSPNSSFVSNWITSSNLVIVNSTNSRVTVKKINSNVAGAAWIKANFVSEAPCNEITKQIFIGKPSISSQIPLAYFDGSSYNNVCNLQTASTNMIVNGTPSVNWSQLASNPSNTSWYQSGNNINFYFYNVGQTASFRINASNSCGLTSYDFGFKSIDCSGGGGGCNLIYALSPNPAAQTLTITPSIPAPCGVTTLQTESVNGFISVIDNQGIIKKHINYKHIAKTEIDVSDLKNGTYYLEIYDGNSTERRTVIVQH